MVEHAVSGHVGRIPGDVEVALPQAVGHVVVLTSPAPEEVGEAVDGLEVIHGHGGHATEDVLVGQTIHEAVDGHGHVSGLYRAGVQVAVVLRQQVDVVEDETLEVHLCLLHGLGSAHVHQHGPVELSWLRLLHHKDAIFNLSNMNSICY